MWSLSERPRPTSAWTPTLHGSRAGIAKSPNKFQTDVALARPSGVGPMHRFCSTRIWMLFALAIALLLGNGMAAPARAAAWSTNDLKTGASLPSGTVTINQVTVTWQVGNYWSDGLRIFGLVCTPTSLPSPRPIAILNHGL